MLSKNQVSLYSRKFISLLILFFFLVFPLIYSRSLEDSFEFPKKFALIFLTMSGIICLNICHKKWCFPSSFGFASLCFLVLLAIFSTTWAYSPLLTSKGGLFFFFQFVLACLFIQVQRPYFLEKCRFALILCISAVAFLALGQLYYSAINEYNAAILGVSPSLGDWRDYIQSTLGNTDFLAGLLCLFFPFLVIRFLKAKKNLPMLSAVLVLWSLTLFVSWSVSAFFSLLFFFLAVMIIRPGLFFQKFPRLAYLGIIPLLAVLFWSINHPLNPLQEGIFQLAFASERWYLGGVTRVIIWENALQIFRDNALYGAGFNNFIYLFPEYLSPFILRNPEYSGYAGQFTNAVHNDAFQFFTELGIAGGLLFLWLCLKKIRQGWQKQDWFIISFFSLLLLNSQMSFPMQLVVPSTLFCLLVVWGVPENRIRTFRVSPLLRIVGILLGITVLFFSGRELLARNIYKQVRALQDAEQSLVGRPAERIRNLEQKYQLAILRRDEETAAQKRKEIDHYLTLLPTRSEQLRKLGKVFTLSPYYYDASSRFADMLSQHQQYEKSVRIYENVYPVLNANDVYWGYMISLIKLNRYEEAEDIVNFMSGRIFRPKDYIFVRAAQQYLNEYQSEQEY